MSGGDDSEAEVAALKAQGQSLLAEVPGAILDAESRAALAALIADMPAPRGTLCLDLAAEPMLGAVRATPCFGAAGP